MFLPFSCSSGYNSVHRFILVSVSRCFLDVCVTHSHIRLLICVGGCVYLLTQSHLAESGHLAFQTRPYNPDFLLVSVYSCLPVQPRWTSVINNVTSLSPRISGQNPCGEIDGQTLTSSSTSLEKSDLELLLHVAAVCFHQKMTAM